MKGLIPAAGGITVEILMNFQVVPLTFLGLEASLSINLDHPCRPGLVEVKAAPGIPVMLSIRLSVDARMSFVPFIASTMADHRRIQRPRNTFTSPSPQV